SGRQRVASAEANDPGWLQVVVGNDLSVALVSQVAENRGIDGIGEGAYRAVGEYDVEPARVGGAEALGFIAVADAVRLGPLVGRAGGVQVPAAGVAYSVVLLRLPHESQVHALLAHHHGVRGAVRDLGYPDRGELAYHARLRIEGCMEIGGGVVAQGM